MAALGGEVIAPAQQERYDTTPSLPHIGAANGTARGILLPSARPGEDLRIERLRRVLNCSVALLGLIVAAPLMVVIAVLVKLSSPGPVFYAQTRVGIDRRRLDLQSGDGRRRIDYGGKLFTIYKFRTMRTDTAGTEQVWAKRNDPRITPIGRVLRKYRFDEIPQLVNVLRGDMNIVGPRPEQPKIFADLRDQIQRYPRRQRVLPGITGWAQVNHCYDASIEDVRRKLMLDLEYIDSCSPGSDLKIMWRTMPVMIFKRGAQ